MAAIFRAVLVLSLWALAVGGGLGDVRPACAAPTRWSPQNTSVFVVSMTRYKGGVAAPWGSKGRLDYDLMRLFKERGVPDGQAMMLTDEGATIDDIKQKFVEFLGRSKPGQLLIFDFSSHGGYNPKTGVYTFSAFDGSIPVDWFFDTIEKDFRGSQVFMLADCCYSGGIVELARGRHGRMAYACLSTTYCHNVAYSGWRFFDCLMRGFGGNPVVDLNGDGVITLDELATFSARHMCFVAEGLPMFYTSNGFDPKLVLGTTKGGKKPAPVGNYVMAANKNEWRKAEIVDAKAGQVQVHYTDQNMNSYAWLKTSQIRPFEFRRYAKGATVEVKRKNWDRAQVKDTWGSMVLCSFDGYPAAYDEWVAPSRIRPVSSTTSVRVPTTTPSATNLSGSWVGSYANSAGGKGSDSLVLSEDARGNLRGTWSGNISVVGRRTGPNSASLTGRTSSRTYAILAGLQGGVLRMNYSARPNKAGKNYTGTVTLTRRS